MCMRLRLSLPCCVHVRVCERELGAGMSKC